MKSQIEALKARARKKPKKIILPEGNEPRVLEAAATLTSEGIADIILIGDEEDIKHKAKEARVSLDKIKIINPLNYPRREELVDIFYNSRKHKGITKNDAESAVVGNRIYFGALLVKAGVADGFVAGASHTTSNVARAALYSLGLDKDIGVMSSSFLVELSDPSYGDNGLFIFGDCAIVPGTLPRPGHPCDAVFLGPVWRAAA